MGGADRPENALEENRFELFRQTIRAASGAAGHALRVPCCACVTSKEQLVSPELFIVAAERYGLTPTSIVVTISHALRSACLGGQRERARLSLCSKSLGSKPRRREVLPSSSSSNSRPAGSTAAPCTSRLRRPRPLRTIRRRSVFIHALKEIGCRFALKQLGTDIASLVTSSISPSTS